MLRGATLLAISGMAALLVLFSCGETAQTGARAQEVARNYLGFDRNLFPGADALPVLRKTFAFSSYWLSSPPGEKTNTWLGRRELLRSQGFGFLLLYRGPESRELKKEAAAAQRGTADAREAASAANKEGFPARAIIFLDIEEGGRLAAAYHVYLRAWVDALAQEGFRSGVYCSGMPVKEEPGSLITTADDIRAHVTPQDLAVFIYNDACPPSPGCTFSTNPPAPAMGGVAYALIWQFAQSPRRKQFTAHCPPGYHTDGNCYAPGDAGHAWFLDVNSASSPDPSNGR